MKKFFVYFLLAGSLAMITNVCDAQAKKRTVKKRTTAKKTTNSRTNANISPAKDTVVAVVPPAKIDSLPIVNVKKSLRSNDAIERNLVNDRTPLAYEHLREDDAVYREKLWREIDIREKMNLPFRYSADEDNGNQRFISILFKAIQDGEANGGVTVFDAVDDDRFTTPMTVAQVSEKISGGTVSVPIYDSLGNVTGTKNVTAEVNLDSFYKFRIKEEVIFDKESSRLFWRILGIAPVKRIITSAGVDLGETELFWVYYPDMRPIFAKYEVYNPKNFGARMSWEELFESRFFYGRIIKSTLDNPYDKALKDYGGLKDNPILQLLEGETIKDRIFNYEQNLWSY
ncbi:MAG TPA: gliding motility protein GldN [Chitinophagaceae bacterium]|nr:gliding motility protein GldN [Chitinophagaceae bacterium]